MEERGIALRIGEIRIIIDVKPMASTLQCLWYLIVFPNMCSIGQPLHKMLKNDMKYKSPVVM